MRPDEVAEYTASPEDLMNCVPDKENGHIKVRRILG
jgi:Asp-tRNA(Asn)/Glu-tRNA(Gln) amidotransferase C subunit